MSEKKLRTTGWIFTIILALLFGMSATMKLTQNEEAVTQAASVGLDARTYQIIGLIEVTSLVLFLIPRTALLGSLLLIAYMGGAIATHLQHQQPIVMALIIQALLWVVVVLRFPEVRQRLIPISTKA